MDDNRQNRICRINRGAFLLTLSALLFAVMAVSVRIASNYGIPGGETTLMRFTFGLVTIVILHTTRITRLRFHRFPLLAARGITGGIAILLYFLSLSASKGSEGVPLTNSVLLGNSYFIFTPLLGALLIRERLRIDTIFMVIVSLAGMYLVVQPDFSDLKLGNLYGLFSSIFAAVAIIVVRELRRTEPSIAVFFSLCAVGVIISVVVIAVQGFVVPDRLGWLILLVIGITSTSGQLLMTYAFRFTRAGEGSLISMTTVIYASAAGILWFGDPFNPLILIGAVLVLGSAAYISLAHTSEQVCE